MDYALKSSKQRTITLYNINSTSLFAFLGNCPYPIHLFPDWLTGYIEHISSNSNVRPLFIEARSGEEIIGVLPLEIKKYRGTRFFSMRRLQPLGTGPSDFFDIPCVPGKEQEAAEGISMWLSSHSQSWDSLTLDLIPESSPSWHPLLNELKHDHYSPIINQDRFFYKINTDTSWEEYNQALHKHTHDLRNRLNRVDKEGIQLHVEYIHSNILNFWDGFFNNYGKRRSVRDQVNSFENLQGMKKFIQTVVQNFERTEKVQLSLLYGNDDIWAYQLDWIEKGIWYHYMPTFDQKFERYSPGKILLYKSIQEAFNRPEIHEFNFMRGQSPYKSQFAWDTEKYICIMVENHKSIRNKALWVASKITDFRDRILDR